MAMKALPEFRRQRQRWLAGCLALLVLTLGAPVGAVGGFASGTEDPASILDFDERQATLIEARIASHAGKVAEAMVLYRKLRKSFPDDVNIRVEYCTFLLDHRQYALARDELTKLFRDDPTNPQAQRLQARLYWELAQYGWSSALYGRIVEYDPNDAVAWSDYAGARLNNTQWAEALANYSRVLELDPDNREVRRVVYEIHKQYGPRLDVGFDRYDQTDEDTTTDTWSLDWSSYVSEATRLSAKVRRIELSGQEQPVVGSLNEEINDGLLVLTHRFDRRWSATAGIGGYNGASSDTSFLVGGGVTPLPELAIHADYQKNRPWTDPAQAVRHDGAFDRLQLTLDWSDGKRTGLLIRGEDWRYRLDEADPYGRERTVLGILSLRLFPDPEIVVGYSYYRSWFDYERDDYRPLVLVEDQAWHGVFGSFLHRPWDDWTWGVSGGWRYDHIRNLDGWYIQPNFNVFLANRLELFGMYEYSSESTGAVGGESQRFQITARVYY